MYVIMEFTAAIKPCVADADWPLAHCADVLSLPLADLIEQNGPTIKSVTVWNARTEEIVAVYRPLDTYLDMI